MRCILSKVLWFCGFAFLVVVGWVVVSKGEVSVSWGPENLPEVFRRLMPDATCPYYFTQVTTDPL